MSQTVVYTQTAMTYAQLDSATWPLPDGIVQLLDDHHLVVLSDAPSQRRQFTRQIIQQLAMLPESEVVPIDGHQATDLASFGTQLEQHLMILDRGGDAKKPRGDGSKRTKSAPATGMVADGLRNDSLDGNAWRRDMQRVIELLRSTGSDPFSNRLWDPVHGGARLRTPPKRRYFIWQDADAMLDRDIELFCRLVNALVGVAAECEHISLDPLVLLRVVFIGGAKLGAYAEDSNGQFCRWLEDEEGSPFWEVASVIDRPPVMTYRIDG